MRYDGFLSLNGNETGCEIAMERGDSSGAVQISRPNKNFSNHHSLKESITTFHSDVVDFTKTKTSKRKAPLTTDTHYEEHYDG